VRQVGPGSQEVDKAVTDAVSGNDTCACARHHFVHPGQLGNLVRQTVAVHQRWCGRGPVCADHPTFSLICGVQVRFWLLPVSLIIHTIVLQLFRENVVRRAEAAAGGAQCSGFASGRNARYYADNHPVRRPPFCPMMSST
jgi:hypothetical protein